ncbi:MAG: integrase [Thermoprotei archaeon]|nr:MAG: integrase [Thermoprotei archaeon]
MVRFELDPPPENVLEYSNVKIAEIFLDVLAAAGASEKTVKSYRAAIYDFLEFLGDKHLKDISPIDVNKWKVERLRKGFRREKKGKSLYESKRMRQTTLHYYSIFVRRFLRWLKLPFKIGVVKMPRRKEIQALSSDEISKLLNASRDLLDIVIVRFLLETGLRAEEALNVRVKDIDFERGEVKVRKGKYGEFRVAFFSKELGEILKLWITVKVLSKDDKLIPLTYVGLWKRLKSLAKRAGVEYSKVRPHVLRHTFATEALRKGMDLISLKNILGHSDVKITQIYTHLVKEDLREKYFKTFSSTITIPRKCLSCGRSVPSYARFCPYCGSQLGNVAEASLS